MLRENLVFPDKERIEEGYMFRTAAESDVLCGGMVLEGTGFCKREQRTANRHGSE